MPVSVQRLVVTSWALLALPACLPDGPPSEISNTCVSDESCAGTGEVCIFGICASADEGELDEIDLEVRPPDGSGLLTQQLLSVDTTVDDRIPLRLKGNMTVTGEVCINPPATSGCEGEMAQAVPARVVMLPALEASIPGRRLAVSAQTGALGQYTVALLELEDHEVRVYPDDAARPPYFAASNVPRSQAGTTVQKDIRLPHSDFVRVMGRVVAGEGVGALGIPDVQVEVEDGGRRISSVAITDEGGAFTVLLAEPGSIGAVLLLKPTEQYPIFPEVELPGINLSSTTDLGDLSLGAVVAPVPVEGLVRGNDGAPVSGASVFVRGDVGIGEVRRLLLTDEEGRFDADLPPGLYDVTAVAPTSHPTAGVFNSGMPIEVGPELAPLELVLSARVLATGLVLTHDRGGVASASLTFVRLGPPGGGEEPVLHGATWQFSTTTDESGDYTVSVDPGRYRVVCEPTPESLAPSWTFVADIFASPDPLDVTLPPPAVFAGQILTPTGDDVGEGAEVRVFARVAGQAVPLGSVRTDADGNFGLRLPDLFAEPDDGGAGGGSSTSDAGQ